MNSRYISEQLNHLDPFHVYAFQLVKILSDSETMHACKMVSVIQAM